MRVIIINVILTTLTTITIIIKSPHPGPQGSAPNPLPLPPQVVEEKRASRRSLRSRRKWNSHDATAPPMGYDDEEAQYLNQALTNSEKTLPVRASKQSLAAASQHSMTELDRPDSYKHSTGV